MPATYEYDLFVVHAHADAAFVREYLLPELDLPRTRVLLIDELPLGGLVVSEIDRGVSRSRYTIAVLSPDYLVDRWAEFGTQLALQLGTRSSRIIPLRLIACELPLRLETYVALDFTNKDRWRWETERLRNVLHPSDAPSTAASTSYPYARSPWRRRWRWLLGIAGGAGTGMVVALGAILLWSRCSTTERPDMVRFDAARLRLGVFAGDERPGQCMALARSEDCAVRDHPEDIREIAVAAFDLDRREVTNEEFAAWLNANPELWTLEPFRMISLRDAPELSLVRAELCGDGLTLAPDRRVLVTAETARRPVTCVTWHGARAYCRAHGKRLPFEAEWELAAKGRTDRPFPWGADLPGPGNVAFELGAPRPVATSSQDVTPDGVYDLGGSVAEWVEDGGEPGFKMLRGGSFASTGPCHLLSSGCAQLAADSHRIDIGFRCARSAVTPLPHTKESR